MVEKIEIYYNDINQKYYLYIDGFLCGKFYDVKSTLEAIKREIK